MIEYKEAVDGDKTIMDFMNGKISFPYGYHLNWNLLMPVIDKIEDLDMSEYHYKWDDPDGERNNFMGYEVDINNRSCSIFMELALDPSEKVAGDYNKKYPTRIEAVWRCVVEFIEYYNKIIAIEPPKMEEVIEYQSLYEFLNKPAGSKLGLQIYEEWKIQNPEIEPLSKHVENPSYQGTVRMYPKNFLEQYFSK